MGKINPIYRNINLSDLLLNSENPRFDPVKHQTETIRAMLEDQKEKLINLAKHIIDFGLNPSEIPIVCPLNTKWRVLEGNRRITALKLLNDPDLVPNELRKIKNEFKKLNTSIGKSKIKTVLCVIIANENVSNEWIRLKHTGQNEGAGIVDWNSQQTGRFNSRLRGDSDAYINFLDYLKTLDDIPENYKNNFYKIKKTNLVRLISDPDIRVLVGVIFNDGIYSLAETVTDYLLALLYDLIFNDLSVGSIYHKADRLQYIENLKIRLNKANNSHHGQSANHQGSGMNSSTGNSDNQSTAKTAKTAKQKRAYPTKRKTLIPSHHCLTISNARILKIFNELKSLDITQYTNGVAVLFRVFIELSCDCYISTYFLQNVTSDSKFGQKIESIATDFESKKIMTKNELKAARSMSSNPAQTSSIKTFHAYVHNKDFTPIADDLKTAWDDLWPFIEKIWA
jgi:hypothetical protein